jgi:hypothetical protein
MLRSVCLVESRLLLEGWCRVMSASFSVAGSHPGGKIATSLLMHSNIVVGCGGV